MPMKIALFGYNGDALRRVAEAGLRRLGMDLFPQIPSCWSASQALREVDGAVICGNRGPAGEAARYYQSIGKPVALLDFPHLGRPNELGTEPIQWRVTPPDHAWLPEFAGPAPTDRLEKLGLAIQAPRKRVKGQAVLILGQRSGDPTHNLDRAGFQAWAEAVLAVTRSLTDSKILWRPHPNDVWDIRGADGMSDPRQESLEEALDRSWLVVTHSSNAGLKALLSGLPVIAEGGPVYAPLCGSFARFMHASSPPEQDQVTELLARIAYTQWTEAEIADGTPLLRLLSPAEAEPIAVAPPASLVPLVPPVPPVPVVAPKADLTSAPPPEHGDKPQPDTTDKLPVSIDGSATEATTAAEARAPFTRRKAKG